MNKLLGLSVLTGLFYLIKMMKKMNAKRKNVRTKGGFFKSIHTISDMLNYT